MKKTGNRSVSLVLGSGGARGLAHIGVIRWLEENGYDIRSISGSSMGALIGGIYAAGKLDVYTEWVEALTGMDVLRLLDFAFSRSGIFSGDRIIHKLQDILGDIRIEDLPLSFTAVATDLDLGREVWLNSGSLFTAIRASMAIPSIFTPVRYEGRLLVDGGLLNPVPIAPTLTDMTDMTIAVSLSGKDEIIPPEKNSSRPREHRENSRRDAIHRFIESIQERFVAEEASEGVNIFDVMSRSIESMKNTIARFKLAAYTPDILIEVPVNACGLFEFHRAKEMIDFGYKRTARDMGTRRA